MTPREGETEGVAGTRTLQFAGADGGAAPELLINADARSGTVRVQLSHGGWNAGKGPSAAPGFAVEGFGFEQSVSLGAGRSELHWQPTWGSGSTVAAALRANKAELCDKGSSCYLTVQVQLTGDAQLFSIAGDFHPWCGISACRAGE